MTVKEARRLVNESFSESDDPSCSTYSNGIHTVRRGYYYTHGRTDEHVLTEIKEEIPGAEIIDGGDKSKQFRGGADTRSYSNWWVK